MDGLKAYARDVARATNLPFELKPIALKTQNGLQTQFAVKLRGYLGAPAGWGKGVLSEPFSREEASAWLQGMMMAQSLLNDGRLGPADQRK